MKGYYPPVAMAAPVRLDAEQIEAALRVMRALAPPFEGEPHRAHKRYQPPGAQHGKGIRDL